MTNTRKKFGKNDARIVWRMRKQGLSFAKIADELGCHSATPSGLLKRFGIGDPQGRKACVKRPSGVGNDKIVASKKWFETYHKIAMHRARKLEVLTR